MTKKIRIVIVENDEDEQPFMREGFESSGLFEVAAVVGNGNLLFQWLDAQAGSLPDLILSDLNMPGKNGYDILTETRANPAYDHLPVIITSTSASPLFIQRCRELGAAAYLVKPDSFTEYKAFALKLFKDLDQKNLLAG